MKPTVPILFVAASWRLAAARTKRFSIASQFREIFRNEGVVLNIEACVFEQIADLAVEYKVGAHGLRGIFEEMISPVLYVIPDRPEIRQVVIKSLFEDPILLSGPAAAAPPSV